MPTPEELVSRIKAKYPQYQKLDDGELATRVSAKYPEYREILTDFAGKYQDEKQGKLQLPSGTVAPTALYDNPEELKRIEERGISKITGVQPAKDESSSLSKSINDALPPEEAQRIMSKMREAYPLSNSLDVYEEGLKMGKQLPLGETGQKIAGEALGRIGIFGTAFNPITVGGAEIARQTQALAEAAGGAPLSEVNQLIKGERGVLEDHIPEDSFSMGVLKKFGFKEEDVAPQFFADMELMARRDPVNTALMLELPLNVGRGIISKYTPKKPVSHPVQTGENLNVGGERPALPETTDAINSKLAIEAEAQRLNPIEPEAVVNQPEVSRQVLPKQFEEVILKDEPTTIKQRELIMPDEQASPRLVSLKDAFPEELNVADTTPSVKQPKELVDVTGEQVQGSIKGASEIEVQPSVSTDPVEIKTRSQIIRDIAQGLGVPIRFGRLTAGGGGKTPFAGFFKPKSNLIGSKLANDLVTVSHEAGHKLDQTFKIQDIADLKGELMHLGDNKRSDSHSSWTPSKPVSYRKGEGVAEFVRYYLTNPETAKAIAPKTSKYFESVLDSDTNLKGIIQTAQGDIQRWRKAPSAARVAASISTGENPLKSRYTVNQLVTDVIDDFHMLKVASNEVKALSGKSLNPSQDPYLLARLTRGSDGAADMFLRKGSVDFDTREITGKGLEQILEPVRKSLDDFRTYIVARRAQELISRDMDTGINPGDVKATIEQLKSPLFDQTFESLKNWSDSFLKYAVDGKFISPEVAGNIRAMNKDYVPFHRVFEVGAGEPGQSGGSGRGLNAVGSPIKQIRGSVRDIVDPLETWVKNAYTLINATDKNAVNIAIADLSRIEGMGKYVERVATPQTVSKTVIANLAKQLQEAGADLRQVDLNQTVQFFEQSRRAPFGENVIGVNRGGSMEFYRLDGELYRAIKALDVDDAGKLTRYVSGAAQLLRGGATLYPDFVLSNIIRDTVSSSVVAKYGFQPFVTTIKGLFNLIRRPELADAWIASGGKHAIEASYFDRTKLQAFLRERITKDLTPKERAMFVFKSPLLVLRALSTMSEEASRVGYYEKVYNQAISKGMSVGDAKRLAAFEARDLLDFAKSGARMKALNQMTAFFNSQVQGLTKLVTAFKDNPGRTLTRGFSFITLPTLGLYFVNRDNAEYWDRPQWERDMFWLIPYGDGSTFIRIPKPFELGVLFGAIPERILQGADKQDKKAMDGIFARLFATVLPKPIPTSFVPLIEHQSGYDFFRNQSIVPKRLERMPEELQFTEQTSLTAKKLGAIFDMSPMKVDHLIFGYTSSLGRFSTHNIADKVIEAATGEESTARGVTPFSRFFTSPPGSQSAAIDEFYADLDKLRKAKATLQATGETTEDISRLPAMEALSGQLSKMRKAQYSLTDPDARVRLQLLMRQAAQSSQQQEVAR